MPENKQGNHRYLVNNDDIVRCQRPIDLRWTVTLIDNILTNEMSSQVISGNLVSDISDHFSHFCIVASFRQEYNKLKRNKMRDFSQYSQSTFNELSLTLQNYSYVNGPNNVNKHFSTLYNKINKLMSKHAPLKKLSNRKIKYP